MAWNRTRAYASSLKKVESTFLYNSPRFMEQHSFLEGSHFRSLCFYVHSNMYMKRSSQHWSNDTERGKPKYSEKKPVSGPLCPPKISHGVTWDWAQASAVKGRQVNHGTTSKTTEPILRRKNQFVPCSEHLLWPVAETAWRNNGCLLSESWNTRVYCSTKMRNFSLNL